MKLEKTIREIDRLVAWGAKAGKITGKALEAFQNTLRDLAAYNAEAELREIEFNAGLATTSETVEKLKAALRCCGLTSAAITVIMKLDFEFMDQYVDIARKGYPVTTEVNFEFMMSYRRGIELRIDGDLINVSHYSKLHNMATESPQKAATLNQYMMSMRDHYPHLRKYFAMVENGMLTNEQEMRAELYKIHLLN
jgi:hypothetical protein